MNNKCMVCGAPATHEILVMIERAHPFPVCEKHRDDVMAAQAEKEREDEERATEADRPPSA